MSELPINYLYIATIKSHRYLDYLWFVRTPLRKKKRNTEILSRNILNSLTSPNKVHFTCSSLPTMKEAKMPTLDCDDEVLDATAEAQQNFPHHPFPI